MDTSLQFSRQQGRNRVILFSSGIFIPSSSLTYNIGGVLVVSHPGISQEQSCLAVFEISWVWFVLNVNFYENLYFITAVNILFFKNSAIPNVFFWYRISFSYILFSSRCYLVQISDWEWWRAAASLPTAIKANLFWQIAPEYPFFKNQGGTYFHLLANDDCPEEEKIGVAMKRCTITSFDWKRLDFILRLSEDNEFIQIISYRLGCWCINSPSHRRYASDPSCC